MTSCEVRDSCYADSFILAIACDANFKLMVIRFTEKTSNCAALRKYYSISGASVWQWKKNKQ
jgi:hypothetical protein